MSAAGIFLIGVPIAFNVTVAERLAPPAYVAWSLWLMATGVVLL